MSVLRFLLSALVVIGGVAVALLIMAVGLLVFLFQRLFGRSAAMPRFRFQGSFRRAAAPRPTAPPVRSDDVIEIEATPVKD